MKNIYLSLLFILFISPIPEGYCQLSKGFESFYLDAYQDLENQNYSSLLEKVKNFETKQKSLSSDEKFYVFVLYYGAYTGLSDNSNNVKNHQSLKNLVDSEKFKTVDKKTIEQFLSQYESILNQPNKLTEPETINEKIAPSKTEPESINEKIAPSSEEISENRNPSEKVATLTVSGQGKTVDDAKNIALRSALELAFGTFISSKTEIFNDELIGDEIVSLSNGNIQNFKIVSQTQLPDGNYTVSLIATVSVTKLTSFVENKGFEIEFKGGLFAENIKIQKLNEDAEYKAVLNLIEISNKILSNSLDFEVEVGEPTLAGDMKNPLTGQSLRASGSEDLYSLLVYVKATPNKNHDTFRKYFIETINSINMKENEIQEYNKINKKLFILFNKDNLLSEQGKKFTDLIYLRNPKSSIALQSFFIKSNKYLTDFNFNLLNLGTFDVSFCCSDDSNVNFSDSDVFGWELNYQEGALGFPNFFFLDQFSREQGSWGHYDRFLLAINSSGDVAEYSEFEKDLFSYKKDLIYKYVDPNPGVIPPSNNMFLENSNGTSDEEKSIIGGFNFVKKPYLHKSILYLNLGDLEKITGFNIKPRNN